MLVKMSVGREKLNGCWEGWDVLNSIVQYPRETLWNFSLMFRVDECCTMFKLFNELKKNWSYEFLAFLIASLGHTEKEREIIQLFVFTIEKQKFLYNLSQENSSNSKILVLWSFKFLNSTPFSTFLTF